jgi:hypothetical protein
MMVVKDKSSRGSGKPGLRLIKEKKMAKSVEHGIRSPKSPESRQKQEKAVEYGVRSVGNDFEKRPCDVNPSPAPKNFRSPGAKLDSLNPSFKKFK